MQTRLSELTFNILMRMICGKRYFGVEAENQEEAKKLAEVVKEAFELSGGSNSGDFLSFLLWIDFGGMDKRMKRVHNTNDAVLHVIDESRQKSEPGKTKTQTLVAVMLSLHESEPKYYSDDILKGTIVALLKQLTVFEMCKAIAICRHGHSMGYNRVGNVPSAEPSSGTKEGQRQTG
ncbi:hypothetical protein AgCh_037248 [Apium graveolens]